jgi:hypothetical protein
VVAGHGGNFSAYVRRSRHGNLRIGRHPVPAIAVFSSTASTVPVSQTLELTPRHGHRTRRLRLATGSLGASGTIPSLVNVRLSAARRRLVRRARAAHLVVRLGDSNGVVVHFRLKATP